MNKDPIVTGKVKTVFDTDDAQRVLIRYEDKVTAWNGKHVEYPKDKGATCCLISALLFEKMEKVGIKTHYIDCPSLNTMLCKKLTIYPIEVIVIHEGKEGEAKHVFSDSETEKNIEALGYVNSTTKITSRVSDDIKNEESINCS